VTCVGSGLGGFARAVTSEGVVMPEELTVLEERVDRWHTEPEVWDLLPLDEVVVDDAWLGRS